MISETIRILNTVAANFGHFTQMQVFENYKLISQNALYDYTFVLQRYTSIPIFYFFIRFKTDISYRSYICDKIMQIAEH